MSIYILYTLYLLLLLSTLLVFKLANNDWRFSLSLVQALLCLPMTVGLYIYAGYRLEYRLVPLVHFSESVFALVWFYMSYRLDRATITNAPETRLSLLTQLFLAAAVVTLALYCLVYPPALQLADKNLLIDTFGLIYFYAIILLFSVLAVAWRLEKFWRALEKPRRWDYKFFVVGSYIICGAYAWATSYRITYRELIPRHFWLLAALLLVGWLFMCYAVARHRLLYRKMFISRKIVYSFVAPTIFAVYFFALGIVSLIMKTFELPLPFVLRWLLVALGFAAIGLYACSGKLRRRVHFFVSTHFYVNKYEYRVEWLALSKQLQGTSTEAEVAEALRYVLTDCLYTTNIEIWFGDEVSGYRSVVQGGNPNSKNGANAFAPDDPLIKFLHTHSYFYIRDRKSDTAWEEVMATHQDILADLDLVLLAPLLIGDQLVGLIGLGPEFTGGNYGYDDFDLLAALGGQTAAAVLAIRMAGKLADARERRAWNKMSAFVLHDVKNAANMLSLARENARDHIQDPQFQLDLLEAVDDALGRMAKVQNRLDMLKREVIPEWQDMELCRFLKELCGMLGKKLKAIKITLDCQAGIQLQTDPKLLARIMENLLLNALEAGGDGTSVRIYAFNEEDQGQAVMEVTDNGPGIVAHLLPEALFEPYKTTKTGGSGIGLWQVNRLMTSLNGIVSAENTEEGSARFVLRLPLAGTEKFDS